MLSTISSIVPNRVKAPIITRFNRRFHPERKDKIAFVKPPEVKSHKLWEQVDPEQREALLTEITEKFLEGHDIVAIDIGKMHLQGFTFTEFNSSSNIGSLLRRDEILHRLSTQTGRNVIFKEGFKRPNENKIRFCDSIYYDVWDPGEVKTYFAILIDSKRWRREHKKK